MMKTVLQSTPVVLAGRLLLGGVFVVASMEKIADPSAFATSIGNYRLVSPDVALVVATILPWLELFCGLGLLFGLAARGSALLASLMLIVFTAGVASALARGLDISCGCFTQDPSAGKMGSAKLAENALLLLCSIILSFSVNLRFTLEKYFRDR